MQIVVLKTTPVIAELLIQLYSSKSEKVSVWAQTQRK